MKTKILKCPIIWVLLAFFFFARIGAQELGDKIIFPDDVELIERAPWSKGFKIGGKRSDFNEISNRNIFYPPAEDMRSGQKHDSIVIGYGKAQYYFKGKVRRRALARDRVFFKIESDIYHVSTGNMYVPNEFSRTGDLEITTPFYYPNGQLSEVAIEQPGEAIRYLKYDPEGNLTYAFTDKTYETTPRDPKDEKSISDFYWATQKMEPNFIKNSRGTIYMGYPHIGTFFTRDGYRIIGFTHSLIRGKGNGSVLFIKNENTEKCYWAMVLDGIIRHIESAQPEEEPDIKELYEQTMVTAIELPEGDVPYKRHDYKNVDVARQPTSLKMMDSSNHSGYGITLAYDQGTILDHKIKLKVGFFKDGKLNGLGYECQLDYDRNSMQRSDYMVSASWNADYGIFEKGEHMMGGYVKTPKPITLISDIFSDKPSENFLYSSYEPKRTLSKETIYFKNLNKKFYVYHTGMHRNLVATQIDQQNKTITVKTDIPDNFYTFRGKEIDALYGFDSDVKNQRIACSPTKVVDNYVNKKIPLFQVGGYEYKKYVVKGVNYDKHVSQLVPNGQGRTVSVERVVKDGTKTITCPICKGAGYITRQKDEGIWCKISLDEPPVIVKEVPKNQVSINSSFGKWTAAFYDSYKKDDKKGMKATLSDVTASAKAKGSPASEQAKQVYEVFNELYQVDKKAAFQLMMVVERHIYPAMMPMMSTVQRDDIKRMARERISNYKPR